MNIKSSIKKCYRIVRGVVATAAMISISPTYIIVHTGWRVISIVFPRKWFYFFDDFLWGTYQKVIVFCFEHMTGVEIFISGEIPNEKENVILICNHQCTVDWVVTDMLAIRQHMIGNLRYVFKDMLKYMPLYGYVFGVHGGVFVKRGGSRNEHNMRRVLKKLMDSAVGMYFVVFPEGTRYSAEKKELLAKSQAYAIENDLKPLNQVLTPRVKAFHCAITSMRKYVTAVYDVTIVYDERNCLSKAGYRYHIPSMWDFLISEAPRISIKFDRIPTPQIPINDQRSTHAWLHSRFERKDFLISRYFQLPQEHESESVIAGVVTSSGNESSDDLKYDLTHGTLSMISYSQTLPSTVLLTGATAALICNTTGRKIYCSALLGGSIMGIVYAKAFL